MVLTEYHRLYEDSIRWRLLPAGTEIENSGIERTKGKPITVTRVWDQYHSAINSTAKHCRVPCALIIAIICTGSAGKSDAIRLEPGYVSDEKTPHKIRVGLMQTLISTAMEVMQMSFTREWLLEPANSILAGTTYIAKQAKITKFDPPLVAAAYNVGRLAYQSGEKNRWKLRQYPIGTSKHCDRFIQFYNDAVFMLKQHNQKAVVGHTGLAAGSPKPAAGQPAKKATEQVRLVYRSTARKEGLSPYCIKVLEEIVQASGLDTVTITSTIRTAAEEARIFYDNINKYGVEHQKKLYASAGDKVIDQYVKSKDEGKTREQIIKDMENKINEIGPTKVSRHIMDPKIMNVFDISPGSVKDKNAFEKAIKEEKRVSKYFFPPHDPCYHLEIPVK